ncbi:MAG: DUF2207 domain-containing protein [Cyanobacteria bacterium J06636_27]
MKLSKLIKIFFIFINVIFLNVTVFINDVNAQTRPFYWEFINVDIVVQNNGDMLVTETQKYTFPGNYKNQRYRYIPLDKVKQITDVSVSENNQVISSDTGIENNQLWIRWEHSLNPPVTHTFVIKYRVVGGLQESGSHLQVNWKAIFPDRNSTIQKSRVTVIFPSELEGKIFAYQSYGIPSEAKKIDNKTIEFTTKKSLPPGSELEVQVTFPKGILNVSDIYSSSVNDAIALSLFLICFTGILFVFISLGSKKVHRGIGDAESGSIAGGFSGGDAGGGDGGGGGGGD